jgi:hypothetical protein
MEAQTPPPKQRFEIPKPLSWQQNFLAQERAAESRLAVAVCGRRSGKTFLALLHAILNSKGLLAGYDVAWIGPNDKVISESRAWFKAWMGPLIVGASPGGLGHCLANGSVIDWWPAGPNASPPTRSRGYGTVIVDESQLIQNLKLVLDAAVRPSLAVDEGKLLLIGTPQGKTGQDFYELYREAQRTGLAYHAPSSISPLLKPRELEHLRKTTGQLEFRQEFGAEFLDREGSLLKREQLRHADPPPLGEFRKIAAGLDIALSSKQRADYSALVITGLEYQGRAWVLHAARWRSDWPTTFGPCIGLSSDVELCGASDREGGISGAGASGND